jgi:metal-sulfur cluster biosynthetic enzyme
MTPAIDDDLVRDALRQVVDPEAGMNIVDLGLVYDVASGDDGVVVQMTMTSAACPMTEMIVDEAVAALEQALPRGTAVQVTLVWDPPWTPERMSEVARGHFGWQGR